MDLEKVKKHYKWDPVKGDYEKVEAYDERRILKKRKIRNRLLVILYFLIVLIAIYFSYKKFEQSF